MKILKWQRGQKRPASTPIRTSTNTVSEKVRAFSQNVIFVDTEFSTLDPYKGELLSVGLVSMSGQEFYIELEYKGESHPWVKKHVLPMLTQQKISREQAKNDIAAFVGHKTPYMVSFVNAYDVLYLYKLFGYDKHPFFWIPIDFASVLFALGKNPEHFSKEVGILAKELGIDTKKYRAHHALDDAKLLRETYLALARQKI